MVLHSYEGELNLFTAAPSYNYFKDTEVEREDYRREGLQVTARLIIRVLRKSIVTTYDSSRSFNR